MSGRPKKGEGGTEPRQRWTIRISPSARARIEAEAKRRRESVADLIESWSVAAESGPMVSEYDPTF